MELSIPRLLPAIALLAALGCGRDAKPAHDSVAAAPVPVAMASTGGRPACPKTGHWSDCQVKLRLDQAGVAPQTGAKLEDLPELGARPTVYMVGKSGLAVYLFSDAAARARAAAGLDTAKFIAPSNGLTMRHEATAIQSDNLLALLYSQNDLQRERVSDALTAGPPQP
jgi:hypothetical protein